MKPEVKLQNEYKDQADITNELGTPRQVKQPNNGDSEQPKVQEVTAAPTYEDIAGKKESYSPNSEGKTVTGQGAEAAVGTDYSWNKEGASQATKQYQQDVQTQKQELLTNRQTMETNAVNYQTQADMMQYQNNQEAEKVGWTGGYVLDQNRQMDYLKSSIQAQMYGAMELQKYGYDTSLAAARLSYDLNQKEFAQKYYEQAVSAALSEAQLTGTYFSAETKDMMSQLSIAGQKLEDKSLPQEERDQAQKLTTQIEDWFKGNGISKEGIKTLESWTQEQANELAWSQELYTRYQAAIEAAKTDITENPSEFIMLDADGKEIWDGTNITTGNWETMNAKSVGDYILSGKNGSINQQAANQFYAYLDSTISGQIEAGFTQWCQKNGYITKDGENTKITSKVNEGSLLTYMEESGIVEKLKAKYSEGIKDDPKYSPLYDMFMNWDFTIQMPDGTQHTYTYRELNDLETYKDTHGVKDNTTSVEQTGGVETDSTGKVTKSGYPIVILSEYSNFSLQTGSISQDTRDDDFDYDLGNGLGGGTKNYNYDIDVDWLGPTESAGCAMNTYSVGAKSGSAEKNWADAQSYLKAAYPTAGNGDLAFDRTGELWIYYNGKWGYVQNNTGGGKLRADLKTYLNGGTPSRWK